MAVSRPPKSGRQNSSNLSMQLSDLTVPIQPRAVVVNNSDQAGNTAAFDLREAEKEHLVVGCCLHRIITPPLRKYVESTMQKSYRNAKSKSRIHTQTFPNHMKSHKGHRLNYHNINNNNNKHKAAENKYDYRVSNHVAFAKLFLQPFMAHMTGFDDSCDMSALLGLICQVGDFNPDVKDAALKVRSEVRNKWAHCDISNWTRADFLRCFQLMHELVKSLKLPSTAEEKFKQDLMDWEQKGVQLILGQVIDKDLLRVVQQDVAEMQSNLVKYKESSDGEVEKLVEQLKSVKKVLAQTEEKFEEGQATLRRDVDTIGESVTEIEGRVTTLEDGHGKLAKQVRSLEDREANVEREVSAVAEKVEEIDRSLSDFQQSQTNVNATVAAEQEVQDERLQTLEEGQVKLESWQQEISESLEKMQITEDSKARKPAEGFFKIPDRNKWFSGRQKELKDLHTKFNILESSTISHKKLAICGLGGCGKTCLAVEYSWRLQETYQGGIYWMSAENNRTFEISLNDIALGIGTGGSNFDDTLARTTAWLSTLQEPWLLIVDNMDEFDVSSEVQKLLEGHWKQTSKGHILITTRREAVEMVETMGFERDNCVELTSMSEDESCAFLVNRTQQEEQPGMRDLARELGGLPLALEQAAAHINVLECAFEDYLKQYKRQRLKLLKRRKVKAVTSTTDKDRMAVNTTWLLNFQHIQQCEDPQLAEAACAMMNITAYLDPDDIPIELVNKGHPCVSQSPLAEYAESPLGSKQIFEVLTQFSLLQRYGKNSWSVHRLVQEVIINRCSSDNERVEYLQSACRMLHFAFSNTSSPQDVLQQSKEQSSSGRLLLWSKLARHACAVWRNMTAQLSQKDVFSRLMLAKEAAAVTHEASVFLSLNKQHSEAYLAQTQTLECVANTEVNDSFMAYITSVQVPLKEEYQKMLHAEMSVKVHSKADVKELKDCEKKEDPESLRQQGNDLFKKKQYSEAIACYTRAINISGDDVDERLYSNRSLCYFKVDEYILSLNDADKCIELNSMSGKAYCRRAFALAKLAEKDPTYRHYSGAAKAAAALAIHHEPTWRTNSQMKGYFPNLNVKEISSATELSFFTLSKQDCTILLKEGDYSLDALFIVANVQIVGVKGHTTVNCKDGIYCSPMFQRPVYCHFEKLQFPQMSDELVIRNGSVITLYRCQASNGVRGCKDFPNCQGGPGCVNSTNISCAETNNTPRSYKETHGRAGHAGLQVLGGTLYVDHCSIIDCGGGGLLVEGEESHAVVTNCEVMKHIQSGLEVRNGGTLKATGNNIHNNRTHGVIVGPGASTTHVVGNHIHNNLEEGVITLKSPVITIEANRIERNGASGISVESSTLDLHDNEIANNWHWGLFLKTHSSANICRNLVHSNKAGGLWFGFNQFGRVLIDENVIRDHTGPAIYIIKSFDKDVTRKMLNVIPKEYGEPYIVPPVITDRNVCQRNDTKQQHPSTAITSLPVGCAFCGDQHKKTMSCGKCGKAQYCSKDCQVQHWQRHKIICNIILGDYSFRVCTEDTVYKVHECTFRLFNPELKGIKQGTPPDNTGRRRFIVKIQAGPEYQSYDPDSKLILYDQTTTLDLSFRYMYVTN
ncbi:STIP1 [Branchiostoma lanceolatum]|uniref:STIP1 protein n=1 Tax=Branchiostoma lanceolatum TaxID=7740 RepID=A0A8K0AHH6_BRALA|nr:STIP1 [Branchiostoma lanceolatum]